MTSPTTSTLALEVSTLFSLPLGLSTNGEIFETEALQHRGIVEVPAVEDRRGLELRLDRGEVRAAEFLPFGDDGKRIGAFQRGSRGGDDFDALLSPQQLLRLVTGRGVVAANARSRL